MKDNEMDICNCKCHKNKNVDMRDPFISCISCIRQHPQTQISEREMNLLLTMKEVSKINNLIEHLKEEQENQRKSIEELQLFCGNASSRIEKLDLWAKYQSKKTVSMEIEPEKPKQTYYIAIFQNRCGKIWTSLPCLEKIEAESQLSLPCIKTISFEV